MKISRELIIRARDLCDIYKVKLFLKNNKNVTFSGEADAEKMSIYLYVKLIYSEEDFLSTLCHELGHIVCFRRNRYKVFFSTKVPKKRLYRYIQIMRETSLKAELYADTVGEKIFKKYFKYLNMRYIKSYRTKSEIRNLNRWIEEIVSDIIKESKRRRYVNRKNPNSHK